MKNLKPCPACSNHVAAGTKSCPNCGQPYPNPPEIAAVSDKTKKVLYWCLAIFVVLWVVGKLTM